MAVLVYTVVLAFAALQAAPSASILTPMAQSRRIHNAGHRTLVLPHPLRRGETAWLLVQVGAVGRGQIEITTQQGLPLGTISPLGARSGNAGGTYTVPVPAKAIRDGRLALRLSLLQPGHAPRAVTTKEVTSLRLVVRRFKTSPATP